MLKCNQRMYTAGNTSNVSFVLWEMQNLCCLAFCRTNRRYSAAISKMFLAIKHLHYQKIHAKSAQQHPSYMGYCKSIKCATLISHALHTKNHTCLSARAIFRFQLRRSSTTKQTSKLHHFARVTYVRLGCVTSGAAWVASSARSPIWAGFCAAVTGLNDPPRAHVTSAQT